MNRRPPAHTGLLLPVIKYWTSSETFIYFWECMNLSLGQCWKHSLSPCSRQSSSLYGHTIHWQLSMSCARHTQHTPCHKDTTAQHTGSLAPCGTLHSAGSAYYTLRIPHTQHTVYSACPGQSTLRTQHTEDIAHLILSTQVHSTLQNTLNIQRSI